MALSATGQVMWQQPLVVDPTDIRDAHVSIGADGLVYVADATAPGDQSVVLRGFDRASGAAVAGRTIAVPGLNITATVRGSAYADGWVFALPGTALWLDLDGTVAQGPSINPLPDHQFGIHVLFGPNGTVYVTEHASEGNGTCPATAIARISREGVVWQRRFDRDPGQHCPQNVDPAVSPFGLVLNLGPNGELQRDSEDARVQPITVFDVATGTARQSVEITDPHRGTTGVDVVADDGTIFVVTEYVNTSVPCEDTNTVRRCGGAINVIDPSGNITELVRQFGPTALTPRIQTATATSGRFYVAAEAGGSGLPSSRLVSLPVASQGIDLRRQLLIGAGTPSTPPPDGATDGVLVWGSDQAGVHGDGQVGGFRYQPAPVPGLRNVVEVAAGTNVLAARDQSGAVWAWGENEGGVLLGPRCGFPAPETMMPMPRRILDSGATAIDVGRFHGLAVVDGKVVEWGDSGYTGCEDDDWYSSPVTHAMPTNVVDVAASYDRNLALTSEGRVYSWGKSDPPELLTELADIVAIDAGPQQYIALERSGTAHVWGANFDCRLGLSGDSRPRPTPLGITDAVGVSMSDTHTLVVRSGGSVVGFGTNHFGQVNLEAPATLCQPTASGVDGVKDAVAGGGHSLAIRPNGEVVGWGNNAKGQLASPPAHADHKLPPTVLPLRDVRQLAAGTEFSAGIAAVSSTPSAPNPCSNEPHAPGLLIGGPLNCAVIETGADGLKSLDITAGTNSGPLSFAAERQSGVACDPDSESHPDFIKVHCLFLAPEDGHLTAMVSFTDSLGTTQRRWTFVRPVAEPYIYVAMGDSYSSGEGNPPFTSGTAVPDVNTCHRSTVAFPYLLAQEQNRLLRHTACSGATTYDLDRSRHGEPPQLSSLNEDTDLVTMTIGGNNVLFGFFAEQCAIRFLVECQLIFDNVMTTLLRLVEVELVRTYTEVASRAPNARIVVVGYPRLFPSNPTGTCSGISYSASEQRWFNDVAMELDAIGDRSVKQVQRSTPQTDIVFVSMLEAFDGGEFCSSAEQYVVPVFPDEPSYSLHPTEAGHRRMAAVIETSLR